MAASGNSRVGYGGVELVMVCKRRTAGVVESFRRPTGVVANRVDEIIFGCRSVVPNRVWPSMV
eukprot:9503285-Pyramimonas_sp.AAC.1